MLGAIESEDWPLLMLIILGLSNSQGTPPHNVPSSLTRIIENSGTRHEGFTDSHAQQVALCYPYLAQKTRLKERGALPQASTAHSLIPLPIEISTPSSLLLTQVGQFYHKEDPRTGLSSYEYHSPPNIAVTACRLARTSRGAKG